MCAIAQQKSTQFFDIRQISFYKNHHITIHVLC